MPENLFELLNAPTSLKPKDLSTHIRMQAAISEEMRNICSRDLFRMDIKLANELTTCRFGRKLPKDVDPDYQQFCESLAVKGVKGIPYKYFAAEYNQMKSEGGEVEKLIDRWRIQAYAAQYLRMAQNAETEMPDKAPELWMTAIRLYQRFFMLTKVEESYTYQYAPDDDARVQCCDAWDSFLKDRLSELGDRQMEYIDRQDAKTAQACLKIFSDKTVQKIYPDAQEKLLNLRSLYVNSIKSASTLGGGESGQYVQGMPAKAEGNG